MYGLSIRRGFTVGLAYVASVSVRERFRTLAARELKRDQKIDEAGGGEAPTPIEVILFLL